MTRRHTSPAAYTKNLSTEVLTSTARWIVLCGVGMQASCPTDAPMGDDDWNQLRRFVAEQRVTGCLVTAIEAGLPTTYTQSQQARTDFRQATIDDLSIESVLFELADVFDDGGIDWRVLKGLATSRILYAKPSLRSTSDVDVLVRPDQFPKAIELIRATGRISREHPLQGPTTARRYRCHTMVHASETELDVHRFVEGSLSRFQIPTDALFARHQSINISGRVLPAPCTSVLILHAMLHLSTGVPGPAALARLSTLADVLRAREQFASSYQEALILADESGCGVPARWADQVASQWLGVIPCSSVHRGRGETLAIRSYDRLLRTPGGLSIASRLVGPQRLRRSWEAIFPSPEYRQVHDATRGGQLRYIVSQIRPARRSD